MRLNFLTSQINDFNDRDFSDRDFNDICFRPESQSWNVGGSSGAQEGENSKEEGMG